MINIVILAAGQGKRMRSSIPKVLHEVAGQSLLSRVIKTAQQLSPSRLVVVLGHLAEQIEPTLSAEVQVVYQRPPQGTGHAVKQALPLLDPALPTLVLYADVPLISFDTIKHLWLICQQGQSLAILTQHHDDPTGYGRIVRDQQQKIVKIVEEKDASEMIRAISEVNTGFMCVPVGCLAKWLNQLNNDNAQGEFYLTDLVAMAVRDGVEVVSVLPKHKWECDGVNTRKQLANLERLYQLHLAEGLMENGVSLIDPSRIDIRGDLVCEEDVLIDVNCVFEGSVQLARGCVIEPNCILKNVSIGAHTRIKAFSHLDGAQIDDHASIGPYARIRPETHIGSYAHVGNFVEMKKTFFGAYSKASHLSYVGDAIVGKHVNIGAGTITCNYDGVNKYQTVIGDGAFIGSDSQLVAPVKIGQGATIGAGTTLTKDAPDNLLTISRTKQTTVSSWARPEKNAAASTQDGVDHNPKQKS